MMTLREQIEDFRSMENGKTYKNYINLGKQFL